MRAASALAYLLVASARGRLRLAAGRVRSPRHFFAMLLGTAWLLWMVASNRMATSAFLARHRGEDVAWLGELVVLAVVAFVALRAWLFGRGGEVLGFGEAEAQLLFAAPVTRRQLVAYKLAQGAIGTSLLALLPLGLAPGGLAARASSAAATWLALTTASLHATGAGLTREALLRHGAAAASRRAVTLAVLSASVGSFVVGLALAPSLSEYPPGVEGVAAWTRALVATPPLSWALLPVRLALDVVFAPSPAAFGAALPGAALVLLAHVAWVFSSDAAFEESALEAARRRSARLDALRAGGLAVARAGKSRRSFGLAAAGSPEGAFAWKALVRASRFVSIPVLSVAFTVLIAIVMVLSAGEDAAPGGGAVVSISFLLMFVPFGPMLFGGDLRRDMQHLELLRALPVRGRRVLLGEMAVPFAEIVACTWALVVAAAASSGAVFAVSDAERIAFALAAAIAAPAISAVGLVAVNGFAVLYPDWVAGASQAPSPAAFGGQLVVGLVQLVAVGIAGVVVALVGGGAFLALHARLGPWAAPVAAFPPTLMLGGGAWIGVRVLGRALERLDYGP